MADFKVILLALVASLVSAKALRPTTNVQHLLFPKAGEKIIMPTLMEIESATSRQSAHSVKNFPILEDTIPAAYHHHETGSNNENEGDEHDHNDRPEYAFKYSVNDEHTGDVKKAWEHRDGDVAQGGYSVVDPDGHIRTVEYTVTKHGGFQATVKREPYY